LLHDLSSELGSIAVLTTKKIGNYGPRCLEDWAIATEIGLLALNSLPFETYRKVYRGFLGPLLRKIVKIDRLFERLAYYERVPCEYLCRD